MTISTFNSNLDHLMEQAVQYFQSHYVQKYRDHIRNVQSLKENEEFLGNVHLYSHIDTDGLCAASILSIALKREEISYQITILKQLEEMYMDEIAATMQKNREFLFFLDFGSGQVKLISEYIKENAFIILDHHQPLSHENSSSLSGFHVNSYFAGVNGSKEISGSGMAYLFAKKLRKDNVDLSPMAIIGAIGDHQNTGEQQSVIGQNSVILQDALDSKQIIQDIEPLLPRTVSLPLGLANELPGGLNLFDNDTQKSIYFLKKIGIKYEDDFGHPRFLPDLSSAEKTKLTSELVKKFIAENTNTALSISNLLITHYLLPQFEQYPEIYDAKDFSSMIDACGRSYLQSIGIACCITQSNEIILKGMEIAKQYSQKLQDAINWVMDGNKITYFKAINAFDGEEMISELIIGVVSTILLDSSRIDKNKPIIGYAPSGKENYKVSARCSQELVEKGVDLSQAIRNTCTSLDLKSKGGGHPLAAGAFIPKELIRQFLSILDQQIQIQLGEGFDNIASAIPKKTKKKTKEKDTTPPSIDDEKLKSPRKKSKGLDTFF